MVITNHCAVACKNAFTTVTLPATYFRFSLLFRVACIVFICQNISAAPPSLTASHVFIINVFRKMFTHTLNRTDQQAA